MKHKKLITLGMVGIASVLTLTACGDEEKAESEDTKEVKTDSKSIKERMFKEAQKYYDGEIEEISFEIKSNTDGSKVYKLNVKTERPDEYKYTITTDTNDLTKFESTYYRDNE